MALETREPIQTPLQAGKAVLKSITTTLQREPPLPPQPKMGFFTDTSLCIGCKACEVACRQWNQLPAPAPDWTGTSYDNTQHLSAVTWRHVQFVEKLGSERPAPYKPDLPAFEQRVADAKSQGVIPETPPGTALPFFGEDRWLMHSDVCKHCANAPCQEACPTGALIRTEFDTVYAQQDICNGCGYCVVACPFGVIARELPGDGTAHKCTLCYDRLKDGFEPACAKACPTDSITFGEIEQLKTNARARLGFLREQGVQEAQLYGVDDNILDGGLHAFFLLLDEPEVYNLPKDPLRPANHVAPASFQAIVAALILGIISIIFFKREE